MMVSGSRKGWLVGVEEEGDEWRKTVLLMRLNEGRRGAGVSSKVMVVTAGVRMSHYGGKQQGVLAKLITALEQNEGGTIRTSYQSLSRLWLLGCS